MQRGNELLGAVGTVLDAADRRDVEIQSIGEGEGGEAAEREMGGGRRGEGRKGGRGGKSGEGKRVSERGRRKEGRWGGGGGGEGGGEEVRGQRRHSRWAE